MRVAGNWIGVFVAVVIVVGVAPWLLSRRRTSVSVDVGSVSDGWLAEQRRRKES
jgi:hypothetical protein